MSLRLERVLKVSKSLFVASMPTHTDRLTWLFGFRESLAHTNRGVFVFACLCVLCFKQCPFAFLVTGMLMNLTWNLLDQASEQWNYWYVDEFTLRLAGQNI